MLHHKQAPVNHSACGLYERGFESDDIRELFGFIDRMIALPEDLEESIWQGILEREGAMGVTYITSVERRGYQRGKEEGRQEGRQEGLREGLLDGIALGLKLRFGADGLARLPEIGRIEDVAALRAVHAALDTVSSLDELRRVYQPR